ncbi:hypothetical protein NP493_3275g00006 [Ridgeia piscesae]|uniref:Uncharacterized protein n=1 Tax=Ridgeia piscesae TaxID=27915 RepID=A0AAD9MYZ3_RIDPI|nr:hypothetical protein NP493_3275g00006 [Ridgeia piscesae]
MAGVCEAKMSCTRMHSVDIFNRGESTERRCDGTPVSGGIRAAGVLYRLPRCSTAIGRGVHPRANTGKRAPYGCEVTTDWGSMWRRKGDYRRAWPAAASERKALSGQRVCPGDSRWALLTAARGYGFGRPPGGLDAVWQPRATSSRRPLAVAACGCGVVCRRCYDSAWR